MTDTAPVSGAFESIPNLRILIDGAFRGTIETRDYERWDPASPLTNWWWITLRRDDGIWVEDSCSVELQGESLEELETRTRAAVEALLGYREGSMRFEAAKVGMPEPEPADAEQGSTSLVFGKIDELCAIAITAAMG